MSGFIPLSVPNFGEKEAAYAAEAITSGWVSTSGAKVGEFEEALAAYVGMPRAVAANSGTSSLHLAAMAAGIRRGDEVIVPTLTFIAAVNPLTRYVGAEPIFIGCNDTLCIDPDAVEDFCANHCTLKEDGLYNNKTGARVRSNHWFYSLYLKDSGLDRDTVIAKLQEQGIQTRPVWALINEQADYPKNEAYALEKAQDYRKYIVNLPCSTNLTEQDCERVIAAVKNL